MSKKGKSCPTPNRRTSRKSTAKIKPDSAADTKSPRPKGVYQQNANLSVYGINPQPRKQLNQLIKHEIQKMLFLHGFKYSTDTHRPNIIKVLDPNGSKENRLECLKKLKNVVLKKFHTRKSNLKSWVSSVGYLAVLGTDILVAVKPETKQGYYSSGVLNEIQLWNTINQHIANCRANNVRANIAFSDGNKKVKLNNITYCEFITKNTKGHSKEDIIIWYGKNKSYSISIKKDNSVFWESADTFYGSKARQILDKHKHYLHRKTKKLYELTKPLVVPATDQEKTKVIFGDTHVNSLVLIGTDNYPSIKKNTITFKIGKMIVNKRDAKRENVYFLIRNDRTRNCIPLGYKGIRILAINESAVPKNAIHCRI